MVCWKLCWNVSPSFRKKSRSGFNLSALPSCLKLFLLTKTMSKEQLLWLLLHWLVPVTTLFYCIFHFLICVCFLTWPSCVVRAVDQCSCWTWGQILQWQQFGDPWTSSFQKTCISPWCSRSWVRAISSCPEDRIAVLLCSSVLGPLLEQLIH